MSRALAPTPEEFRTLARTSQQAWSTIRFLLRTGPWAPVRAWIARPDRASARTAGPCGDGVAASVVRSALPVLPVAARP